MGVIKIRIAVISDIHGNIVALEAILEELKEEKIDKVIALGDIVNELPNGNEVIDCLKSINAYVIKGNKEEYLLGYEKCKYNWKNLQFKNIKFMYHQLTEQNKRFIRNLPFDLSFEIEGVKLKFVHGSPESICELIYDYNEELIDKYTKNLKEDVLILGHIHDPIWIKERNEKTIINAGCAGVSVYNIGQAEYVILDINDGSFNIESKKVNYSLEKVKENIIKSGILEVEKTFINLVYLALIGKKEIRKSFYREGIQEMKSLGRKLHKDDAKDIYKVFKLIDDDIWTAQTEKIKHLFLL